MNAIGERALNNNLWNRKQDSTLDLNFNYI